VNHTRQQFVSHKDVLVRKACIGLAVPGRAIRSLVAEDRASEASATSRDRTQRSALGPRDTGNPGFSAGMSGHER